VTVRHLILGGLVLGGLVAAGASAWISAEPVTVPPPAFNPASNPFPEGIYSTGIIESDQPEGTNTAVYPEVSGVVVQVMVREGQGISAGTPLLRLDDSVPRATAAQQEAQAQAALAVLKELKAEPRPEVLNVSRAQVDVAAANLRTTTAQLTKVLAEYQADSRSVSVDAVDNARNTDSVAQANLELARRQYDLTQAGAWVWDVQNQQRQYEALSKAWAASAALLDKYTLRAPRSGVVLSVNTAIGSYVSPAGTWDSYTQSLSPIMVIGRSHRELQVRCYVDEILVPRLPPTNRMAARMFIRGTNISVPLEFVRIQPLVSPKINLSNERQERVDVRVLPLIFRFHSPPDTTLYPGQLVDVYVGSR
jgi:HlyD family secretion protein